MNIEEALTWIANLFQEPVDDIKPDTSRDDIAGWDSLGILTLMAALDDDFDIQLADEEIQNLRNVEDILKILKRHDQLQ